MDKYTSMYYMFSREKCIKFLSLVIDAFAKSDEKYYAIVYDYDGIAFQCSLPIGFFDKYDESVECVEAYAIPFIDSDGIIRIESYVIALSVYSFCIFIDRENLSKDEYFLCYFCKFCENLDDYIEDENCLVFIKSIYNILEEDYSDDYNIEDIDKKFDMLFRTKFTGFIHFLH